MSETGTTGITSQQYFRKKQENLEKQGTSEAFTGLLPKHKLFQKTVK